MNLMVFLKGLIIGGTMLVPGISGGSMAIILGIYKKLLAAVSDFMKDKRANFLFLLIFCLGAGVGMLLFAKPLQKLISLYPQPMLYFFLGVVAGGIPLIWKAAKIRHFSWKLPVCIGVGILAVWACSALPTGMIPDESETGMMRLLLLGVAGFIAAIALVLPGISVSYLLLILGLYDETMQAISSLRLSFLLPLGLGLVLGVILTTRLLDRAMTYYPQPTYLIILGFVLGSVAELFPGVPSGVELMISCVTLLLGFVIIRLITQWERKQ